MHAFNTDDIQLHAPLVQSMWDIVQQRTTEAKFGSTLRKLLLSGTVSCALTNLHCERAFVSLCLLHVLAHCL